MPFKTATLGLLRFSNIYGWRLLVLGRQCTPTNIAQFSSRSKPTGNQCGDFVTNTSPWNNPLAKRSLLAHHRFTFTSVSCVTHRSCSSNEVVTFVNSQEDFDKFYNQLVILLQSDAARKFWGPKSGENLQNLCHLFVEKNCDCMNIYSFFKSNPSVLRGEQDSLSYNIQYLYDLGLRSNQLLYVLNGNPTVWKMSAEAIQERVKQLWNLGLSDGRLQKAILSFPEILSTKKKRFQSVLELLRKLQFTSSNICQIITDSPQVFDEDEYQTELKLQYVLFMMGVTDYKEILKAKIFNYTHEHIRLRHLVLERLGLYQVPDKHGRTKIRNPSLCRIVDSTDKRFATACAGISLEEYNAFSESLKAEIAEKEEDELQSDEDEEEEETDGFEGEKSRIEDNEGKDESR